MTKRWTPVIGREPCRTGRPVPVMVRGGRVHQPSKYRVHGLYATFDEAAEAVHALRRDETIAWAYIPDKYAPLARASVRAGRHDQIDKRFERTLSVEAEGQHGGTA